MQTGLKIAFFTVDKITDEELMSFLTILQQEIQIRLHPPALGSTMVGAR